MQELREKHAMEIHTLQEVQERQMREKDEAKEQEIHDVLQSRAATLSQSCCAEGRSTSLSFR